MSSQKSSTRKSGDIEEGLPKNLKESPSLDKRNSYRIISHNARKTRKSPPPSKQPHNPAVIESTKKAMEYARKANAADKIKNKWREYKRRHPRKSIFQRSLQKSVAFLSKTFYPLLVNIKGGKKTRKQKRKI